jgi:adenylate cyclase
MPFDSNTSRWKLCVLALAVTLGMAGLFTAKPAAIHNYLQKIDARLFDLHFKIRGAVKPESPVVLAMLDDKSIKEEGHWPWPRAKVAGFLRQLSKTGAAVVGLDLGFFNRDAALALSYLDEEQGRKEHDSKVKAVLKRLKGRISGGGQLAGALRDSPVPMVLGYYLHMDPKDADLVKEHVRNRRRTVPLRSSIKMLSIPKGVKESMLPVPESYLVEPSLEELNQAAELMGFFNIAADKESVVRNAPLVIRHARPNAGTEPAGYDYYPSLALNMLRAYLGKNTTAAPPGQARKPGPDEPPEIKPAGVGGLNPAAMSSWLRVAPRLVFNPKGVKQIAMGGMVLQTTPKGEIKLNPRGPAGTFARVSWVDVLKGRLEPGALKDKLVVVGDGTKGQGWTTVFDTRMPSSEVQANILENLINRQWLKRPEWGEKVDLAIILMMGGLCALILPFCSLAGGWLVLLGLMAGFFGFNHYYAFVGQHWMLSLIYPLITLGLVFGLTTLLRLGLQKKAPRQDNRALFSSHVSDSVRERILENPQELKLNGQRRELSIFYSDLKGFSAISEDLEPEELTALINNYLREMSAIIMDEAGTMETFKGDAITAFWNAPFDQPDHAERAVRAALRCRDRFNELGPMLLEKTGVELQMRVGVNTGLAVVGNLGLDRHYDYTVMGDAVKLAARLERANHLFNSKVLVDQGTWLKTQDIFEGRELGRVFLNGNREAVTVYEPICLACEDSHQDHQAFAQGLHLIRSGNPMGAIKIFEQLRGDYAGEAYYNKLRQLAEAGETWHGIWRMGE